MNRKTTALLAALMVMALLLAACGPGETTESPAIADASPTSSATASASPSQSPSASPSATPALPVDTPIPGPTEIVEMLGSFKDLAQENDLVVRGKFTKKRSDVYNAIRSMDDPADPDPIIFIDEEMYEFTITEVYKANKSIKTTMKKGDVIVINTPLNDMYTSGQKPPKDPRYMDIELNQEVVLFLMYDDYNPNNPVYRQISSIYMYKVEDERLFAISYDQKLVEEWNKGTKSEDGIPVANLKKDLGIK